MTNNEAKPFTVIEEGVIEDEKVLRVLRLEKKDMLHFDIAKSLGLPVTVVLRICKFEGPFKRFESWS